MSDDQQQHLAQSAQRIADMLNAEINAAMAKKGPIVPRHAPPPTIDEQLTDVRRVKDSRDKVIRDLHYLSEIPLPELQARFADKSTAELIDERGHYAQHGVFCGEPISDRLISPTLALSVKAAREAIAQWQKKTE